MRWKAETSHTYRGTTQTKGKNPKPRKSYPGGPETFPVYTNVNVCRPFRKANALIH